LHCSRLFLSQSPLPVDDDRTGDSDEAAATFAQWNSRC
jgi:hypothetical protein